MRFFNAYLIFNLLKFKAKLTKLKLTDTYPHKEDGTPNLPWDARRLSIFPTIQRRFSSQEKQLLKG